MPIKLTEPKRTLRIEAMANYVGIWQLKRRSLLQRVGPQLRRRTQLQWRIELLLSQLHDLQTSRQVGQLDHGRVVEEEEVLRRSLRVRTGESLAFDAEDAHPESTWPGLVVCLEEDGLACVARSDVVRLSWGLEEALLEVFWQIGQDGEFALHNALCFDMCGAEAVAVLVEVVLLHLVHCCAYLL